MECPDAETLGSMIAGALPAAQRAAIANHSAACETCHAVLAALLEASAPAGAPDVTQPSAPAARAPDPMALGRGARIGRYVIEARLGAGGMGVVYAARDPELGRRVAVKLLRAGAPDRRLRREAQALARLSHAHVVAVHDVGEHDGQTFVAMALVDGVNLRQWLASPRTTDEILRVLIGAGRGLIAAHAAGLVHRDLKPDNVFVAADGLALVGDFGLAFAPAHADDDADDAEHDDEHDDAVAPPPIADGGGVATESGTLLGTPAYMAPEQAAGAATAASDQFSFCVTAWHALYGARPFAGATLDQLLAAIAAGTRATPDPARARAVPAAVHDALVRGLAADPAARFPSMAALIDVLTAAIAPAAPAPPRARARLVRAIAAVAAIAGVAAGVVIALVVRGGAPAAPWPCADAGALPADVWGWSRRAAIARAFAASGHPAGATIATAAIATIDRWTAGWSAMRVEACRADQPARQECLDESAAALAALVTAWQHPDAATVMGSLRAAQALPSLDGCRAGALAALAPPADAHAVRAVADTRRSLARTRMQIDGTRAIAGARLLAPIVAEARRLAYPPLLAEALVAYGEHALVDGHLADAETALREGREVAEAAHHDLAKAQASIALASVLRAGRRLGEARAEIDFAAAALVRAGGSPALESRRLEELGLVLAGQGDRAGGLAALERSLALERTITGDHSGEVAERLGEIAVAAGLTGDHARAEAAAAEAAAADRALYGDNAAAVAGWLASQARQDLLAGDLPRSIAGSREGLALAERFFPPGHVTLAIGHADLAADYEIAGDPADAAVEYQAAIAIRRQSGDVHDLDHASALDGAAVNLLDAGRPADALPYAIEAIAVAEALGDPGRDELATALVIQGRALLALGRPGDARAPLERALVIREALPDVPVQVRGSARYQLARALSALGELDRARALGDQAIADFTAGIDARAGKGGIEAVIRARVEARRAEAIAWRAQLDRR